MDDESQIEEQSPKAVPMPRRDLLSVLVLGGIVGLLVWGFGQIFNRYVFDVIFCQNNVSSQCASSWDYAATTAVIAGGIVALIGLIRLRVYRPLLIVMAVTISLWGVVQLTWGMERYLGALIAMGLYLLAYGLYAWVARLRLFWAALVATAVLIVAVRLALVV